jgi:hypothetical protein
MTNRSTTILPPAPGRRIGGSVQSDCPLTQTDRAILNAVMAAPDAHSALLAVVELFRAEDSLSH